MVSCIRFVREIKTRSFASDDEREFLGGPGCSTNRGCPGQVSVMFNSSELLENVSPGSAANENGVSMACSELPVSRMTCSELKVQQPGMFKADVPCTSANRLVFQWTCFLRRYFPPPPSAAISPQKIMRSSIAIVHLPRLLKPLTFPFIASMILLSSPYSYLYIISFPSILFFFLPHFRFFFPVLKIKIKAVFFFLLFFS